jgi:hypothetical protein
VDFAIVYIGGDRRQISKGTSKMLLAIGYFVVSSPLYLFFERLQTRFFPVESPKSGKNRNFWCSTPAQK